MNLRYIQDYYLVKQIASLLKRLEDFLKESAEKIGKISKKITLDFTVSKTFHATVQQDRHLESGGDKITDDEILETVRKASERIIEDTLANHIDVGDRFIVREANTDLNIVCSMSRGDSRDSFLITVITVMRTEDFRNQKDSWVVMVR